MALTYGSPSKDLLYEDTAFILEKMICHKLAKLCCICHFALSHTSHVWHPYF